MQEGGVGEDGGRVDWGQEQYQLLSSWDKRKVVSHSDTFTSSALLLFSILFRPLVDDMSTISLVARACTSWLEDMILVASSCLSEGQYWGGRFQL